MTGVKPRRRGADACAADAKAGYARVSSSVTASLGQRRLHGQRRPAGLRGLPQLRGRVYDIDDTRDSIALAPATCVRLFDGKSYAGAETGLLCAPADRDGLFADLGAMNNRASSMRVCPASAPSRLRRAGDAASAATRTGAQRQPGEPGRPPVRIVRPRARTAHGPVRPRRRVRVRLADARGRPIAGAALQVLTREVRTGADWRLAPEATTGADGRGALRLAAGPRGRSCVEYRATIGDAQPAAVARARLNVRAGVTLRVSPRRVRAGRSIRLRGRLRAAPATGLGKVVTLQARERGRWRDFASTEPAAAVASPRATASRAARAAAFPIRAVVRADALLPVRHRPLARGPRPSALKRRRGALARRAVPATRTADRAA